MRLLTHNTLRCNIEEAKGKGFPLKINAIEISVEEIPPNSVTEREMNFVRHILPTLDWSALVKGASDLGIKTLPPTLIPSLAEDPNFLKALYHILMNVHLIKGMLICPITGREFPVTDGIPNMILQEEECEKVRF